MKLYYLYGYILCAVLVMHQERNHYLELMLLVLSGAPLNIFGLGAGKIFQEYVSTLPLLSSISLLTLLFFDLKVVAVVSGWGLDGDLARLMVVVTIVLA